MSEQSEKAANLLARPGQTLREHLTAVGELTEIFAGRFGAASWGWPAGLLHDIGKAGAKFQRRVRGENLRVDHSTAGARQAAQDWHGAGKLLAYCIAGHHAGLPDGRSNENSCLQSRLDPSRHKIADYSDWRGCLRQDQLFSPDFSACPFDTKQQGLGFRIAFFLRMLFSCLVDADRLDAEKSGDAQSRARSASRVYPGIGELEARLDMFLKEKMAKAKDTEVNRVRAEVLSRCREAAALKPGLFSLTVPTGGGKTFSSLAFALAHAQLHGLDRVIYVIPFTSIIEQNADEFRNALKDEKGRFVVEHHSNLVTPDDDHDDQPHPATENWDAPLIVTTNVQFFESLFSARAGRCRKLHNLTKSVIVLDEAQMLPLPFLLPCIEALRELSASYGASVVLCTATQPALNAAEEGGEGLKNGFTGIREIIADPKALHIALKRVVVQHVGKLSDAALVERLAAEPQVLCIVPTRRMALKIFNALRERMASRDDPPVGVFHMSALMCPQHRTLTLQRIKEALQAGRPCRVVSTSLVEAGVDIDFPTVYRAEAGMDSIAQAAGRCNREGRPEKGRVFVFTPESGLPSGVFRRAVQAGRSVIERHKEDLLHPDAMRDYFLELYWQSGDVNLDAKYILKRIGETAADADFPFREIERDFQLIDAPMQGVVIPYDEQAKNLTRILDFLKAEEKAVGIMRRLQRYSVSLYERDMGVLEKAGVIRKTGAGGRIFVLCDSKFYDEATGLDLYKEDLGVIAPEDCLY
ncbi:MAG: CRISPR-associated endonuclease Cas3'' [Desulfovibrio sp.]|jgi:CRISPR-associated endonuclease/helicase Cas3|nr:CRISPR-associated endonuclease Cas3'' [Desulfovibrio sp.]